MSQPNVYSPSGWPVLGTEETIPAVGQVIFRLEEGELDWEFNGSTDIRWDGQVTGKEDGEVVFVDKAGERWKESELVTDPSTASVVVRDEDGNQHALEIPLKQVSPISLGSIDRRDLKGHVREKLGLDEGDRFEDPQNHWEIRVS
jgi:hypothetical protein